MAKIFVTHVAGPDYEVVVEEKASRSTHRVTVTADHISRYAPGVPVERLLQFSFEFLLQRESKESILPRFDLEAIERYFPEYPRRVRQQFPSQW